MLTWFKELGFQLTLWDVVLVQFPSKQKVSAII
jgi:hypothetical protein